MEWEPINERLIKARFNSKYCKLTIIQCYAPTNDSKDEVIEDWYEQLQAEVTKVSHHDMLLVMRDMNAKVGSDNTNRERAMGSQGCETINNDGERLENFCLNNSCAICGTKQSTNKKPDQETQNVMVGPCLENSTDHIPRVALRWTPTGNGSKGHPKTTWRERKG